MESSEGKKFNELMERALMAKIVQVELVTIFLL